MDSTHCNFLYYSLIIIKELIEVKYTLYLIDDWDSDCFYAEYYLVYSFSYSQYYASTFCLPFNSTARSKNICESSSSSFDFKT